VRTTSAIIYFAPEMGTAHFPQMADHLTNCLIKIISNTKFSE